MLSRLIKASEGFHRVITHRPVTMAVPYQCPAGYWTIGYGMLCQADHPPITIEEGEAALERAIPVYMAHALRLSPGLRGDRLTAIADFVFNLGPTRYAASTLRRRVNEARWESAAVEIRKWVWGGGRRLPGLVTRREIEACLIVTSL